MYGYGPPYPTYPSWHYGQDSRPYSNYDRYGYCPPAYDDQWGYPSAYYDQGGYYNERQWSAPNRHSYDRDANDPPTPLPHAPPSPRMCPTYPHNTPFPEHPPYPMRPSPDDWNSACYNCGSPWHHYEDCPRPLNKKRIKRGKAKREMFFRDQRKRKAIRRLREAAREAQARRDFLTAQRSRASRYPPSEEPRTRASRYPLAKSLAAMLRGGHPVMKNSTTAQRRPTSTTLPSRLRPSPSLLRFRSALRLRM